MKIVKGFVQDTALVSLHLSELLLLFDSLIFSSRCEDLHVVYGDKLLDDVHRDLSKFFKRLNDDRSK